ncbi:hypothetical protein EPO44_14190 [bacterium]|nr:MAG: hypothetical protein EPO44_14190 [bacterium]
MRILGLISVVVAMIAAQPSHADWQYTKWGMTSDEVVTASEGKAKPGKDPRFLEAEHSSGRYAFKVSFTFSTSQKRLESVTLYLLDISNSNCGHLAGALFLKYGVPASDDNNKLHRLAIWRVPSSPTQISFWAIPNGSCTLTYMAMVNENNEGL